MIHRIYREWRKVFRLSATFLLAILVVVACKKKTTTVGDTGIDPTGLLAAGAVDTFSLETYTIFDDSISTKNPGLNVVGEMNDPVFGNIKTSFYTQLRLNAVSPEFGDLSLIKMDSTVLAMQYFGYTGDFTAQTFEVFQTSELIDPDAEVKYYEFDSLQTIGGDLVVPGEGTVVPDPVNDALIDTVAVEPQLRLPLDTNFAKLLMAEAVNTPTTYASNDNFLDYFNGLHIRTNNTSLGAGKGGVFSFNMSGGASKMTIYYQRLELVGGVDTWVKKSFDFVINSNSQSFNKATLNHFGTEVQDVVDNKALGLTEYYAQAFGTRGVVSIPGLSNLPENAIIQKAILDLPIQYQTGSKYSPGLTVNYFTKDAEDVNIGTPLFESSIPISDFSKSIQKDITEYAQNIVSGLQENKPIYISPAESNRSGDRIIFNGPNTLNKVKPKLYIIYTEF